MGIGGSRFGSGSGLGGLSTDMDSFASKPKSQLLAVVSGNETYVNIEYEASEMFDLHNVIISIPLPALREVLTQEILCWNGLLSLLISRTAVVPWNLLSQPADRHHFAPSLSGFSASSTFSDLKVTESQPLKEGNPPKFSQRARLLTANYQVV
ncbi:hypothetical protein HU200_019876 [Digitaria exilis]|uniref:Coatomer subunit delta n=1 Tax=Digitaria exilis TaxID=1010633 RepID=A0A835F138_9POAL|nr:hypothetical protein HU200_019876 [Digitaria exilis]